MHRFRATVFALIWALVSSFALPIAAITAEQKIKVALFIDRGASDISKRIFRAQLDNSNDVIYECVYGEDIRDGALKNFDAIVLPGGSANKEAASMGPEAREEVRRFVRDGGVYMGDRKSVV